MRAFWKAQLNEPSESKAGRLQIGKHGTSRQGGGIGGRPGGQGGKSRQPEEEIIRARAVELTDAAGQTRLELTLDERGEPGIKLLEADGAVRLDISLWGDEPQILLRDERGNVRLLFAVGGSIAMAHLFDRRGNPRLRLRVEDDLPQVDFLDGERKPLLSFTGDPEGGPAVVAGPSDGGHIALGVKDDGRPAMVLAEADLPRIALSVEGGSGGMTVHDAHGVARLKAGTGDLGEPHIALTDPAGNVRVFQGVDADGGAGFTILDGNQDPGLSFSVGPDGAAESFLAGTELDTGED